MPAEHIKLGLRKTAASVLHHSGALQLLPPRSPEWRVLMYHRITTAEHCGLPAPAGHVCEPRALRDADEVPGRTHRAYLPQ